MKIEWKKTIEETSKPTIKNLIDILLKNRDIKNQDEFLKPPSPLSIPLSSFGFKKEMEQTLILLEKLKETKQMIVIYTDYDADGITGGTILWETLHLLGFKVMPYVPHRMHEGYGFSIKGIDNVKKEFDPALIISVDHGISGKKEIEYATSVGIKVIVTDHHLAPAHIPDTAEAIFHIPALSGSGVAYFFAKEIYNYFLAHQSLTPNRQSLSTYFHSDYLALATIGTIADLVPLIGTSRSVVYHGLKAFKLTKREGIKHIIHEAGIVDKEITPYEIGFIIAPRINAVGRLEHAIDALRLLCTHNAGKAQEIASHIGDTNKERQELVTSSVKEAKEIVEKMIKKEKKLPLIITLTSTSWNEGIIGLIASKITESYSRPTIVMTKAQGFWKGSARSVNDFHMTDFLRSLDTYLISVGGHKGAAGFSIYEEKKDIFLKKVQSKVKKIAKEEDFEKKIRVDIKIPLRFVTFAFAQELEKLSPFGMGNPNPIFMSEVNILEKKLFGKKMEHVRLYVKDAKQSSFPMEFISFFKAQDFKDVAKGQTLSIIYNLDINRWNGKETLRGKIQTLAL